MITVCALLWEPNKHSFDFSRMYDETWVEKLYRGFKRNLSMPFKFVLFTDKERAFVEPIQQVRISAAVPDYGSCIEPYKQNEPMILCGLDTVVTGNCDELARYCLEGDKIGLPRDPYRPRVACNGVALVPGGFEHVALKHRGQNDMEWVREFPHVILDDKFPGAVQSYKGHVEAHGVGDTRIVYFHGKKKPHEIDRPDILKHWV